jgi:VanZ family protein
LTPPVSNPNDDRRTYQVAVAVWALVILTATSVPGSAIPTSFPHWADKIVHFTLYGVLGALAARAFVAAPSARTARGVDARNWNRSHAGWLAMALLAIFAGVDELHQYWIRGRTPSAADWFADVAGVGVGIAIGMNMRRSNGTPDPKFDRETRC